MKPWGGNRGSFLRAFPRDQHRITNYICNIAKATCSIIYMTLEARSRYPQEAGPASGCMVLSSPSSAVSVCPP